MRTVFILCLFLASCGWGQRRGAEVGLCESPDVSAEESKHISEEAAIRLIPEEEKRCISFLRREVARTAKNGKTNYVFPVSSDEVKHIPAIKKKFWDSGYRIIHEHFASTGSDWITISWE